MPISAVAAVGAVILLATAARGRVVSPVAVLREAPWQVVIFSLGMYLVVFGLRNAGLTSYLAGLFEGFGRGGVWGATYGVGVTTAVLSSIMNNMPTVLVGALAIQGAHVAPAVREAMVFANVVGCDLGPKVHADRLSRDPALAARPGAEGRPDRLGLLLPGGGPPDHAHPPRHPGRARAAPDHLPTLRPV